MVTGNEGNKETPSSSFTSLPFEELLRTLLIQRAKGAGTHQPRAERSGALGVDHDYETFPFFSFAPAIAGSAGNSVQRIGKTDQLPGFSQKVTKETKSRALRFHFVTSEVFC